MHSIRNWLLAAALGAAVFSGCNCPTTPPGTEDSGVPGGGADDGGGGGGGTGNDGGGLLPDGGVVGDAGTPIIVDPIDPANATRDSDCDGLSDFEEFGSTYAGGKKTDPALADTDGDGIKDGVELGRTTSVDAACGFVGDADSASKTLPTELDSDLDGLPDGIEDADRNGRIDPGETNPSDPDSDSDGLADGAEDANFNGTVDANETDPRKKDTDGDGINDGVEVNTTLTNPTKADTDGDTCNDGLEDTNQNGNVDSGETNPKLATDCGPAVNPDTDGDGISDKIEDANNNGVYNPNSGETDFNSADTDADGLTDGLEDKNKNGVVDVGETNPRRKDSDCDGLIDGPTVSTTLGEDQNKSGTVDGTETDPTKADTDGDGISDGVELGLTANPDATNCPGVVLDGDPTTKTNPTNADTDGDGIADGAEDSNQNGKVDTGELNPTNGTDGSGPAGQVCTAANLRPVVFRAEGGPDLQLGLPSTFTEVSPMVVSGSTRGLIGYDSVAKVAFIAWRQAAPAGATTPTADETAIRANIATVGAITLPTTQTFTTWDGVPALQAFYDQAGTSDVKTRANDLAVKLVGTGAGSLSGLAGATGPFKLQAEYVHRTNTAVVVVLAITPTANFVEPGIFSVSDTAGGSALAQFGDANAVQCETFKPASPKVDFLFVVDDSCSMAASQTALADAAGAMATSLNNSALDWRIAMVTTSYHSSGGPNVGIRRGFTRNISQFTAWLTQNSQCSGNSSGTCSGVTPAPPCGGTNAFGANGGCWVGTGGNGAEGLLGAARKATDDITPATVTEQDDKVRSGAQLVVVFLGDADDQTSGYTTAVAACGGAGCEQVTNFTEFFLGTGSTSLTKNKLGVPIAAHGIVCPFGVNCNNEYQANPQRHAAVITATGGVRGDINNTPSITNAMATIVNSAIASSGYKMQKPPIGASVKVALDVVSTPASCSASNIPRSRVNGFDFDGVNRTISFFGACRPTSGSLAAAVSYRYWIDTTPNPGGNPPPCSTDSQYDPTQADFCKGNLVCNQVTNVCECPANCGGTPPPGKVCNTNNLVCDFVCTPDCGGTCSGYQTCNTTTCGCQCATNATCSPGFKFQNGGGVCGCVCDTTLLGCGATYDVDANACACACKPDCGGCGGGLSCNAQSCACTTPIN